MPKLYVYPQKGEPFFLNLKNEKISVGRSKDNTISIPDSFCSSHHAFISPSSKGYAVTDNSSKNGTFLNGKKVLSPEELKKGDEVLVGSTRLVFDKELTSPVVVLDKLPSSENINTILNLKEVLRKPDMSTTLEAHAIPDNLEKIKTEYHFSSIISEVSQALVLHRPLDELLDHIMDLICMYLSMDRGVLMLKEGQPEQLIPKVVRVNNKRLVGQKIKLSQSIIHTVLKKNSSVLVSNVQSDIRFKTKASIIRQNISSAMCVPLWNNQEIIGVIYSDRIFFLDQFSDDDLRLLTLLSNLAAIKIENAKLIEQSIEKEKMEKELEFAAQIQKDFLPKKVPKIKYFKAIGSNIPCYQVGGDYYDFIPIDDHRFGIAIADVSGKGVSASLLMASLRAFLHAEIRPQYQLGAMAARLNDFIHKSSSSNLFISFFFCEINTQNREIKYVNAGHNPPLLFTKKGSTAHLECSGMCLGMFPSMEYDVKSVTLKPEDTIILYTDGITECRNKKNKEFTEENLIRFIRKNFQLPLQKIMENIYDELNLFSSGVEQADDMTLVLFRCES